MAQQTFVMAEVHKEKWHTEKAASKALHLLSIRGKKKYQAQHPRNFASSDYQFIHSSANSSLLKQCGSI